MKTMTVPTTVIGGYAVVASFVFSATIVETIMFYPNIFRDIPESLVLHDEFMSAIGIGDIMRPLGAVMTLCALIACAAAVRYRIARGWVVASLASLVAGQFLLSVLYQWPRASILFDDRDQYTVSELESAATEFLIGHGLRMVAALITAVCAVVAALACHRVLVLARAERALVPAG
ncbi:hypothetical protein DFR74_10752 [Nocardia puris]|uniref:DUF1772 domain-containing protein n=2 Tax=Nocardia puris TaxID=208602 RepID=A0A366DHF2_9NOCA|nr:hypothetical protein DFR74_10752 [Nocardia puris]